MRFLADENFPLRAVDVVRQEAFDVSSIREILMHYAGRLPRLLLSGASRKPWT